MKKIQLCLMIFLLLAEVQILSAQTENRQKSFANSELENLKMQKTTTDSDIGSKKIFSETNFENVLKMEDFVITGPEVNWQFTDPAAIVCGVKVSPNTQNSFVGWELNDERVSLYQSTSTPLWERQVVVDWVFPVDMTEDGSVLAYGAGGLVEVFNPDSNIPIWDITIDCNVDGVVLSPDGTQIYISAENFHGTGFTHILSYTIGSIIPNWEVAFEGGSVNLISSGDGSTLVFTQYGGEFSAMWIMDATDGSILFEGNNKNQYPPAASYDGSLIVNGDYSGFVHVYEYDSINNTYFEKWNFHVGGGGTSAWVVGMGISGDGSTIVVGTLVFLPSDVNGEIYLFNSYSPEPVWVYENAGDLVESIDLSYDGSIIAAVGWGPLDHTRPDFYLFRRNSNVPIYSINTPGSMFVVDLSPEGTMCSFGGKAVHARQMGSGGFLYNINSNPGGGSVSGFIDLENNEDNSGVRIEIPELNNYFAYSDVDGSYTIQYVPVGTYSVVASKVGYYSVTVNDVIVVEGEITNVDINMLSTGNPPQNLFASKGAGLSVDLYWDPPEEKSITGFNIYRKTYMQDLFPEEPLASVSATEFTYSDFTALPTRTYYYAVTCTFEGGAQSPYTNIETGWISTGFVTNEISVYIGATPVIDGIISEGEWDDAFKIDCSDFLGQYDNTVNPIGSVIGYFKTNEENTELYVAYINYNDIVLEDHDEVALYIDDNNDGSFPPPDDLSEGNFWAAHYASGDVIKYRPIFNTGGVGTVIYLTDPQIAVSNSTGYIVYEFVIPIGTEYWELNPSPEGKSSLAIFVLDDPSGFDGWWPLDNQNLFAPDDYGTLTLNAIDEIPPAPDNISISIIESTAIIEWNMPEINDFNYFNIYYELNREFSLLDNTLGTQFLYDLPEYGLYKFYVTTVDNSGQESDPSEIIEIEYGGTINQDIILHEGFQFISSYIIPPDPDMMVVMADVLNDNLVFARNSLGQTLRKIGPNWVNGIGDWIIDEGYLIKMNADDSFVVEGVRVNSSTVIPVPAGFKFVSYFPENAMDALIAFGSIIGDDLDFIRDSEGTMIRKIGPNWVNGIGDCQPGEGYLVKMFANDILIYPGSSSFTCGDPFTDPRNNQTYETVQIGDQCWMAKNLNIGTMINGSENMSDNGVIEKYCYDNDLANCEIYGGLYQWNEMMEYVTDTAVQGICPEGWYLPTDHEWKILEGTVDSQYPVGDPIWEWTGLRGFDAGLNLKSTSGWYGGGNGSGLYNYEALPGGCRDIDGYFFDLGYYGYFWSSAEYNTGNAWYRLLFHYYDNVYREYISKNYGFSVRCVQDNSIFDNLSIRAKEQLYKLPDSKRRSNEAVYFVFEGGNPAEAVYTLYIKGLEIGDEVAAFDGDKIIGAVRINSENAFENELPVFSTLTSGVGYEEGNPIILKVWSENKFLSADFTLEAIYDSYVYDVYPDNDGEYSVVNITKAATLLEDLLVYPNPATNMIFISSSSQISNVVIFNCFGQSVYEGKSMQIKTENFESGVYVIRIETDNGIETRKFTVK